MCRWVAYTGRPERLENIVTRPARSLVHQSLHATQCKTSTNGDGFGIGWYGNREAPGLYREISPAWSDENLLSLCAQLEASTFFAHVRASTGASTARVNCHPFSVGRWLFMHNGQIGGFSGLRRRIENMIPDRCYPHRRGATDSEAIFLIALGEVDDEGPVEATRRALVRIVAEMEAAGVTEPLRFAAAMTDGRTLTVFRWSSDPQAPSVWFRRSAGGLVVVSEPIDDQADGWQAVGANHVLVASCGEASDPPVIVPFELEPAVPGSTADGPGMARPWARSVGREAVEQARPAGTAQGLVAAAA
ncbi:MAG: class II glutamine amidotransferase [Burkholderiaceae bacterium]|nr:class II glutamine amidotransferase [Burkholderiaceae bacterium]